MFSDPELREDDLHRRNLSQTPRINFGNEDTLRILREFASQTNQISTQSQHLQNQTLPSTQNSFTVFAHQPSPDNPEREKIENEIKELLKSYSIYDKQNFVDKRDLIPAPKLLEICTVLTEICEEVKKRRSWLYKFNDDNNTTITPAELQSFKMILENAYLYVTRDTSRPTRSGP